MKRFEFADEWVWSLFQGIFARLLEVDGGKIVKLWKLECFKEMEGNLLDVMSYDFGVVKDI